MPRRANSYLHPTRKYSFGCFLAVLLRCKQLVSIAMNTDSSSRAPSYWRRHLETCRSHDNSVLVSSPLGEVEEICNQGELTDHRRRSTRALGASRRNLYVDQLRFLPPSISDTEMVYLRATRMFILALLSLYTKPSGVCIPHNFDQKPFILPQ